MRTLAKGATVTLVMLGLVGIFGRFQNGSGLVQSAAIDESLTSENKFFDPSLGTNDQACVTCHQPSQGYTISVDAIQDAFDATNGMDPLFRLNDTADRPDADVSTLSARAVAYRTTLSLGVTRIGMKIPPGANFIIEPQETAQFGRLPNPNDPQTPPGSSTLSLFRRPLVNTNVHFDSAVLWDGRADILNMPDQVKKAARTLLLSGGPTAGALGDVSDEDAAEVAAFMLGTFTDQVKDDAAGPLNARGATSGIENLLALAVDPAAPCTPLAPPETCTPTGGNPNTFTLFDAWANLPPSSLQSRINRARAAIASGQEIFNTHCTSCHETSNIGNSPSASFFFNLGVDSPEFVAELAAEDPRLNEMLERLRMLPEYCLRPTSNPTPFSKSPCGKDFGDVRTTDPGRALVTGQIEDVGSFKAPILRGLPSRAPYFHNGAAGDIETLINFYNVRFQFGLTDQEREDLGAFLEAL